MSKFFRAFYDIFSTLGHPALGGIATFTFIGIFTSIPSSTLAIAFIVYTICWTIMVDYLRFLGWDRM